MAIPGSFTLSSARNTTAPTFSVSSNANAVPSSYPALLLLLAEEVLTCPRATDPHTGEGAFHRTETQTVPETPKEPPLHKGGTALRKPGG